MAWDSKAFIQSQPDLRAYAGMEDAAAAGELAPLGDSTAARWLRGIREAGSEADAVNFLNEARGYQAEEQRDNTFDRVMGNFVVPAALSTLGGMAGTELLGLGAAGGSAGPMGEGALGSGLRVGSDAGSILGAGGGEAIGLGSGITPGASASGGGGALGTGIGFGASGAGSYGALANDAFKFSSAGMEAIGATPPVPSVGMPPSVPSPSGGGSGSGLRAPAGAQLGGGGLGSGAAPASPAALGGGVAPGAGGGAVAGAAGGGGTAAGVAAGAGTSFVDSLIKQMKDNAVGLGMIGAGTMMAAGQKTALPNEAQIQSLGAEAQGVAKQLIQQYQTQTLSPGQQASLDQLANNTKNQLRQYFASIGQSDSTAAMQALAQVDTSVLSMKQEMLDSALAQGLSAIGIAQGPYNTIAQYQLGQDAQLRQAFGNFATAAGTLFGRQAGTPQPAQTSVTAAPTITSAR